MDADYEANGLGHLTMWGRNLNKMISFRSRTKVHTHFLTRFAVGMGNIWRFPYLCYRNGGGAFFIPYIIMLVCGGIPVFMLEVGLGQYMSQGGLHAWNIAPLFKGIGIAMTVILFLMNIYYIFIMAWAVFYFIMSLTTTLPWSHCNNSWNTESLTVIIHGIPRDCVTKADYAMKQELRWLHFCECGKSYQTRLCPPSYPTVYTMCYSEFWDKKSYETKIFRRRVLQITDGIDKPGGLVWETVLCLLFVWTMVYFCVWRGIKWSGKVVYFTALFPYLILTTLLIRAVTLDGAIYGIKYYLSPDFSRLSDPQVSVWIDGGTQIFFSYAVALGCMITLGSYNKFHTNFYRCICKCLWQCMVIASVNSGTSLFGGFVVFSVLGFMAKQQNVDISDVVDAGPGLAFITYPKAVTQMPVSQLWAALFFFMIFLIGIDSQFVAVEGFTANVMDSLPKRFNTPKSRMVIVAAYCFVSFLIGLCMTSRGGMYVFQLFDYYSASGMVLLFVCFMESIVIGWVFGADKFYDIIELMIGYRINKWLLICWKFLTPAITMGILMFQIITFKPIKYNKTYVYPEWAQAFGVMLAVVSIICIPTYIIFKLWNAEGSLIERFYSTKTPILKASRIPQKWKADKSQLFWACEDDLDDNSMPLSETFVDA
ncbi:solute carrier family 6 (neurotransmitter transporter, GABA) member 6/8/11/12/13 [Mytilus galloprovincialis]|uniref:Transporter n=2 Tax=Mytilus galloprovincialis TaxID=29158 RepID=A0A8B6DQ38_MYTGA|nr:solute carrier family 6 (neurotransmitter transporter, GABA) member 6/8/11/12/13 [Mytilus galloprovincialis]